MGKVHVDLSHLVAHQEEPDLAEREAEVVFLGVLVQLDGTHAESHFDEDTDTVKRDAELLRKLGYGDALLAGATDFFKDPHVAQGLGCMETEGSECDFLGFELGVRGRNFVLEVVVEHGFCFG